MSLASLVAFAQRHFGALAGNPTVADDAGNLRRYLEAHGAKIGDRVIAVYGNPA